MILIVRWVASRKRWEMLITKSHFCWRALRFGFSPFFSRVIVNDFSRSMSGESRHSSGRWLFRRNALLIRVYSRTMKTVVNTERQMSHRQWRKVGKHQNLKNVLLRKRRSTSLKYQSSSSSKHEQPTFQLTIQCRCSTNWWATRGQWRTNGWKAWPSHRNDATSPMKRYRSNRSLRVMFHQSSVSTDARSISPGHRQEVRPSLSEPRFHLRPSIARILSHSQRQWNVSEVVTVSVSNSEISSCWK